MPDQQQIFAGSVAAAPKDYVVGSNVEMILKAVTATFTDNGAASDWLPTVELISDSGHLIARASEQAVKVTAGAGAIVSWFPWRRGVTTSSVPVTPLGNLIAWYDYSDTSTFTLDGSGKIAAIADKSGNGHTALQSTAARRPSTTTVNGLTAGLFASANTTCLSTGVFGSFYSQPITIACVVTQTVAGAGLYWPGFFSSPAVANVYHLYVHHNDNYVLMQIGNGGHIDTGAFVPFTQTQFTCTFAGGSSSLRVNGSQINGSTTVADLSGVVMGTQWDGQLAPGEIDFMDGACCEFMYFQGNVSVAQLAATEAYLKSKWGTP